MAWDAKLPAWIYVLIDNGDIVYIGVTHDLNSRMPYHKHKSHNAVYAVKISSRMRAESIEKKLIVRYRPKYNEVYLYSYFGRYHSDRRAINL